MITPRSGLIIWVNDLKSVRALEKHGMIYFVSQKLKYVIFYVNRDKIEETMNTVQKLAFVKKVDPSYLYDLKTEYSGTASEKKQFIQGF